MCTWWTLKMAADRAHCDNPLCAPVVATPHLSAQRSQPFTLHCPTCWRGCYPRPALRRQALQPVMRSSSGTEQLLRRLATSKLVRKHLCRIQVKGADTEAARLRQWTWAHSCCPHPAQAFLEGRPSLQPPRSWQGQLQHLRLARMVSQHRQRMQSQIWSRR
jgi:hypothetical protein